MDKKVRDLARSALIAAMYVVLTHFQNLLLPGSASWSIQCRMSEMLNILAFFTLAAIPGLTIGCLIFNLTFAAALPIDWVVGTLATLLSAASMWALRRQKICGLPLLGLLMPALFNALLVGLELTYYFGGGFFINAFYVALGELIVMLLPGTFLYYAIIRRHLEQKLFS